MRINRAGKSPRAACCGDRLRGVARQRRFRRDRCRPAPALTATARKFLEGRWILESVVVTPPGAKPITLKGTGVLNYDDFGNLEMNIKADEASSDLLRAGGIMIPDGVISTTGRTAIDMQNKTLTYILEGQAVGDEDRRRTAGAQQAAALGSDRRCPDADHQGRQRRAGVGQPVEEELAVREETL